MSDDWNLYTKNAIEVRDSILALRLGGVTYFTTLIYIFPIIFTDSLPLTGTPSDTEGELFIPSKFYRGVIKIPPLQLEEVALAQASDGGVCKYLNFEPTLRSESNFES